jgi:outer membrane protein OmpA-like peptidoglycan-associated protein
MILARSSLAVAAIALFGTAACEMTDPSNPNRNTQTGAVVGAGIGALLGASTGGNDTAERRRNAIIGAAIGGGLGAVNQLIVTMPQDILFATDSATLTGGLQNDLYTVARSINAYPNTIVQVIGHTDNTGSAAYNQDLSLRRAQAVTSVLINAGVPAMRIQSAGRGENQPVADNLTPQGRAQNRRVEIIIIPTN